MIRESYESYSESDTAKIAEDIAKHIIPGDIIFLDGDLGAGKTVFTAALVKALGVSEYISSPTFTIVNEYSGKMPVYHFDAYRIADPDEMFEIGFEEYISGEGLCIIEWSSNIEDILPEQRYEIKIERDYAKGENYRIISVLKGR